MESEHEGFFGDLVATVAHDIRKLEMQAIKAS